MPADVHENSDENQPGFPASAPPAPDSFGEEEEGSGEEADAGLVVVVVAVVGWVFHAVVPAKSVFKDMYNLTKSSNLTF